MKKSALLVALSAASLASGIALAQTYPQSTKPATDTKPEATGQPRIPNLKTPGRPWMPTRVSACRS